MTLVEALQPESPYVFYSDDHGFCINTADVMDILNKESKYHWITLCKDCKYYKLSSLNTGHMACHYVVGATVVRKPDDFCSRAERKDGEAE